MDVNISAKLRKYVICVWTVEKEQSRGSDINPSRDNYVVEPVDTV